MACELELDLWVVGWWLCFLVLPPTDPSICEDWDGVRWWLWWWWWMTQDSNPITPVMKFPNQDLFVISGDSGMNADSSIAWGTVSFKTENRRREHEFTWWNIRITLSLILTLHFSPMESWGAHNWIFNGIQSRFPVWGGWCWRCQTNHIIWYR